MQMMVPQAQLMVSEMPDRASASPAASAEHADQRRNSDENSEQLSGSSGMSEGSDMSDESESDDDVSDNETLAARHNSLKRTASADAHVAKRRRSSSDSGSRSSHSRKRRNLFPVIRKSQRCGKCHTCLNPQLKKACLTVREQMMREARKGSHSTTSAAPRRAVNQQSSRSSPPAAATDVDKYSDLLVKFINASGGVSDIASVQAFVTQLPRFDSSLARMLPCTVLGLSSRPVLAEFMARGGVDVLSNWMLQAMEDDNEPASQLLVEILGLLKKLPVTKAFVQSTKSAKVVGALRKHDNADVRKLARDVVALWMKAIPPSSSKATSARPAVPAAAANAAGEKSAGSASASSTAAPAAKRPRTAQDTSSSAADPAANPPRLAANGVNPARPGGANASAAVGGIHVVSDNDLFKVAAKPRVPGRLQGLNKLQPKKVQTIEPVEAGRLLTGKPPLAQPEQPPQQQDPRIQLQIQVDEAQQSLTVNITVIQPPAPTTNSKNPTSAGARGPSTSSVSRLAGRRLGFGASLSAKPAAAGDSAISALLGGAWADSNAAGGGDNTVGGNEPAAKKARKGPAKRVSWRSERELVAVRWFIRDDPPVQACKDAHLSEEQLRALAAAQQQQHSAFNQAARMEHMRERQIIEQQHKEAQEAAARMRAKVEAMQPQTEWYGATAAVNLDPAWQVAFGEDSTEAKQNVMPWDQLMAALTAVNPRAEPLESHQLLQPPSALFNVPFHDRNVKIVPLNTAVQAAATAAAPMVTQPQPPPPAQQLQQQFGMDGPPPPPPGPQQQQQHLPLPPPPPPQQQQGLPGPPQQQPIIVSGPPPAQQQQQPGVLQLQQIAPPGPQGGQLMMQPFGGQPPLPPQHQQQQQPPGPMFAQPPVSSGPVSGSDQLMQALQSLSQGGLLQALQGGGPMSLGGPPPQQMGQLPQPMLPPQQQQQQQMPGLPMPPQQGPPSVPPMPQAGVPLQVLMPDGRVATIIAPGQPGQPVQLPPGVTLLPQQQQQQPPQSVMQVQQQGGPPPPQFQQQHFGPGGPVPVGMHDQHTLEHHDEHAERQWGGTGRGRGRGEGGRGSKGRGGGRGRHRHGDHGSDEWRRNKRECKYFTSTRGCQKGDKCDFLHIVPGEKFDVRDERRAQQS